MNAPSRLLLLTLSLGACAERSVVSLGAMLDASDETAATAMTLDVYVRTDYVSVQDFSELGLSIITTASHSTPGQQVLTDKRDAPTDSEPLMDEFGALMWRKTDLEPIDYQVVVTLRTSEGNVLCRRPVVVTGAVGTQTTRVDVLKRDCTQ